jgi:hypothetical protein
VFTEEVVYFMYRVMKLKQKVFIILTLFTFMTSLSLVTVASQSVQAYTCPAKDSKGHDLKIDESDGIPVCYYDDITPSDTHDSIKAVQCPDGATNPDGSRAYCKKAQDGGDKIDQGDKTYCSAGQTIVQGNGDRCQAYKAERVNSNTPPTKNDGTPVNGSKVGCEADFTYDSQSNRCAPDNDKEVCRDNQYRNNPYICRLPVNFPPDATHTPQQVKNSLVQQCIKSGKTQAVCDQQANDAAANCNRLMSTSQTYKSFEECMVAAGTQLYGCNGGPVDLKTNKCPDGSDPTAPQPTQANPGQVGNGNQQPGAYSCEIEDSAGKATGTKVGTNLIPCQGSGWEAIGNILKLVLMILTIMIGIVAVGGIVYGAILYSSARDNSSQTQQAITIIRNIVFGLLLYGFMIAIINWLIPGGLIQ